MGSQLGTGTNWDADVCIPQGFLQLHLYLGLFWLCRSDLDQMHAQTGGHEIVFSAPSRLCQQE